MDRFETNSISQESNSELHNLGLEELSDEQILNQIEEITRSNQILAIENQTLDKYSEKIKLLLQLVPTTATAGGTNASSLSTTPSGSFYDLGPSSLPTGGGTNRGYRKRSKSRSTHGDGKMRLTSEQKCDIAVKEIEDIRVELQNHSEESEKELDTYKAILEESEIRLSELKKDAYEFDRSICKEAVNPKTHKVMSEVLLKYVSDNLKSRESFIDKMRLKNTSMRKQKNLLSKQLKQKEELGEVLLEVDFKQLKIENKQYLEKIEEKNTEMSKLKKMVGVVSQSLNSKKNQLNGLLREYDQIKEEIRVRKVILEKLNAETTSVNKDNKIEEVKNKKLRNQLENFKVPEVNDYVQAEDLLYNLKKELKVWERKVEIAEMAYKITKQTWIQTKQASLESNYNQTQMHTDYIQLTSKQQQQQQQQQLSSAIGGQ